MILRFYLFIFLAFLFACDTASNIKSPSKSYFIKYFGSNGNQTAVDLIVNGDGTFFILGNSRASTDSMQKVYLAHANAQGELIKQITYGSVEMDARDFVLTADGKIAVVASANTKSTNVDILLSRFTLDLAPVDNISLFAGPSNSFSEYANSLTELSNGDFIVEGYQAGNLNIFEELHIKVYNQGSLVKAGPEWQQLNGAGTVNKGVKTFQHNATSYYTFGTTNANYQTANKKFWTYPLPSNGTATSNGDISMFERAGVGMENTLTDVVKVGVGGYLLVGISASPSTYALKAAVTNSSDTALVFGPAGVFQDVLLNLPVGTGNVPPFATAFASKTSNYNFILTNTYDQFLTSDILLTKVYNDLSPAWGGSHFVQFGGDGDDTPAAVAELSDGHIIVLGTMQLGNPAAQFKIALMKLNASGKLDD